MKKFFILILTISVLFTGCSKTKEETTAAETTKEYFNITAAELVAKLEVLYSVNLELRNVVDSKDDSKIAAYTFRSEEDAINEMIHYTLNYDDDSDKLSQISFFFDKNYKGDLEKALIRYCYHITAISEIIESDINSDELVNEIVAEVIEWEDKAVPSLFINRNNFTLHISCNDNFYNAVFLPIKK